MNAAQINHIRFLFKERYGESPILVESPGRINLIGEHTDYNQGFVLPASIDKGICVAVSKREDDQIFLYSTAFNQQFHGTLQDLQPNVLHWPNYILGVADQLQKNGCHLQGFYMVVEGDVPIGAGMSSSAAVECASCYAFNAMFDLKLQQWDMVKTAQAAEHNFAGVKVGIMDMFASMFGKKDQCMKLDCRTLDFEYIPFPREEISIVLLNTNVKHTLAASAYNKRRQECEQGVEWVRQQDRQVKSLRDISLDMLSRWVQTKDEIIYKRCRYVVEENLRVLHGVEDLKKGDIAAFGKCMFRSHVGLRDEYEVSAPELDFLVEEVSHRSEVLGARMMGGGFGGCTINLVRKEAVNFLIDQLSKAYKETIGLELTAYVVQIEGGTSEIL
jgi:galactokinase